MEIQILRVFNFRAAISRGKKFATFGQNAMADLWVGMFHYVQMVYHTHLWIVKYLRALDDVQNLHSGPEN